MVLIAKAFCNRKSNYLKGKPLFRVHEQKQCSLQLQDFRSSNGGTTLLYCQPKLVKTRKEQIYVWIIFKTEWTVPFLVEITWRRRAIIKRWQMLRCISKIRSFLVRCVCYLLVHTYSFGNKFRNHSILLFNFCCHFLIRFWSENEINILQKCFQHFSHCLKMGKNVSESLTNIKNVPLCCQEHPSSWWAKICATPTFTLLPKAL